MTWLIDNFSYVWGLIVTHVVLSAIPIVAGFAVAVPIGWYASRQRKVRGILLGAGSLLYTIPSLPLFMILPLIIPTGSLSPTNVVIALTMYAAAIMVRAASDAFLAVSPEVLDAAKASGYSSTQLFVQVQLPLAGPVLLAGLRVVAVSTVSLLSVGALVGVSNLGTLFTDGFLRGFTTEIVIGVVATVLVAFLFDGLLLLGGRLLLPWAAVVRAEGAKA